MSSSVTLRLRTATTGGLTKNPLPQPIQTPSGLAILELQGTINLPNSDGDDAESGGHGLQIGRLSFPDYHPEAQDSSSTEWMKRVHLYIGQHQRLTGEMKKLSKAIAIIRKRVRPEVAVETLDSSLDTATEDLELVDIVKYKLVFSHRPEPVGSV